MNENDLKKVRVYDCPICGLHPVRPLKGEARPCNHCQNPLTNARYVIEDELLLAKSFIDGSFWKRDE